MRLYLYLWDILGTKAHCLLDSGWEGIMSSSEFMRANKLPKFELEKPIILQLACVGSKSTVQYRLTTKILLGNEKYDEYFDIANVNYYNVILGTLFLCQFEILLDFKNHCVKLGKLSFPNRFSSITPTEADENENHLLKEKPKALPAPTSKGSQEGETSKIIQLLPSIREVNHEIKLIDPSKVIRYRTPQCPESLKEQLIDKINQYITTGWW
ncbi:hypothetical protein M422DRAFT_163291 [Sphaerobolus stellatus SS14]|uniref:Uncharacterized protein n=1 Tax=Sphaerobolus stellatus (strain SS14) TaxID=990650 RepID=A0A0C9W5R6_SPHS4|nr:hypothetical protein M422DRAFT_163291 [Sphaerobolus stellatus SS14]